MSDGMSAYSATEIRHSEAWRSKCLFIDWFLGNVCNYSCSYCPPCLHDGSRAWTESATISRFAARIIELCTGEGRIAYFQLFGGEVTLMPGLAEILTGITRLGGRVGFISNGSRPLSWWRRIQGRLAFVILTYHPEKGRLEHLRHVAELLSQTARTHVNIAAPPEHFDHCLAAAERLEASCRNISITLKPMLIDFGNQLYPYSEAQLEVFRTRRFRPTATKPLVSVRGEMILVREDGSEEQMPATEFLTRGLNAWRGWSCHVGQELLSINDRGQVFRGLCREGGQIGHVSDPDHFTLPVSPVVCTRDSCVCQTDIMVSRRRSQGAVISLSTL